MDWLEFLYRYATSLGIGPNENQKPWQQWIDAAAVQFNRFSFTR